MCNAPCGDYAISARNVGPVPDKLRRNIAPKQGGPRPPRAGAAWLLNQNLMGSADCEPTLWLVSDSSLPAPLNFGPSSPWLGPFLLGMAVGEGTSARWTRSGQ